MSPGAPASAVRSAAASSPGAASSGPPAPSASSAPPAVPSDPTATEPLAKALQASLDRLRRHAGIPGVSATIVFADGSRWTGVSGLADVAAGRKVTPDTAFAVGSISKTFLATLILALAAEGRIDLDASVRTYLPAMRF
ncbi:MAG TPA: serine hydrolase, partial [Candidatus Limnocylindrales bacterium]